MDSLCCPDCRSPLNSSELSWSCSGCSATFPALRGIPDLRIADDVFLPNADDWAIARRLDDDYDRLDFRGLLDRYYDLTGDVPGDRRARQVAHILAAPGRARQWVDSLELDPSDDAPILDLGCGPGGFLSAAVDLIGERPIWGLDIAMRWLLLARKRLDDERIVRGRLVCACAERMPFAGGSFGGIVAGDVIEHVADPSATLAESYRVLRPGGRIVLATPNRFSLAPEPHVGVWGVGFLPRRWMAPYVRLLRGLDFRAIRTRGQGGWRRILRQSPFGGGTIAAPPLPESELTHFAPLKQALGLTYNRIVTTRAGQALAKAVGPLFHLVAERRDPVPAPSRAIPRRSRPREASR